MTGQRNRALAHVVEAQSHALLLRSATLEASTTPDQYKKRLVDEQPGLIPEPWGEPGRRPENLDKKTQKPKGYNLQKVLGLENHSALHAQNLSRISNLVTMYLQRATPYSQQDMTAIVQVITEYLDEQPIFCCYQDRWPIKSYIKSILSTRADANRKLNAKVARDSESIWSVLGIYRVIETLSSEHAINQAANVALPSANAVHTPLASAPPVPAPAPTPALTPAPALTPTPANDPAPQPPVPTSHQAPADAPRPFGEAGNDVSLKQPHLSLPILFGRVRTNPSWPTQTRTRAQPQWRTTRVILTNPHLRPFPARSAAVETSMVSKACFTRTSMLQEPLAPELLQPMSRLPQGRPQRRVCLGDREEANVLC
ncbi:hypothetical protein FRC08_018506 [Ceratobasidium sp. 394]|nr:hypothetical protein FRC08_018506 [Ceratobasidium sp. 394]